MPVLLSDSELSLLLDHLSSVQGLSFDLQDLAFDLSQRQPVPASNTTLASNVFLGLQGPEQVLPSYLDDGMQTVNPALFATEEEQLFVEDYNMVDEQTPQGPEDLQDPNLVSDSDFSMYPSNQDSDGGADFDELNDRLAPDYRASNALTGNVHQVGVTANSRRHKNRTRPTPYSNPNRTRGRHGAQGRGKGHQLCFCLLGGGGGGGGGAGNQPVLHNWTPDCNRAGYLARLSVAHALRGVDNGVEDDEGEDDDGNDVDEEFETLMQQRPIAEPPILSAMAKSIIQKLANTCRQILTDASSVTDFSNICSRLSGLNSNTAELNSLFSDNSLTAIIERVEYADAMASWSCFVQLLNLMHFRLIVESEILKANGGRNKSKQSKKMEKKTTTAVTIPPKKLNRATVLRTWAKKLRKKKSHRTLCRWLRHGTACCLLSGSEQGSLYLLVIAACSKIKTHLEKLPMDQWVKLGALIRCPAPDTIEGQLVIHHIIPAIRKIRGMFDMKLSTMLSPELLESDEVVDEDSIESDSEDDSATIILQASDLKATDEFFDKLEVDAFVKARDWDLWVGFEPRLSDGVLVPSHLDTDVNRTFLSSPSRFVHTQASSPFSIISSSPLHTPQPSSPPQPSSSLPPSSPVRFNTSSPNLMHKDSGTTTWRTLREETFSPVIPYSDDEVFTINTNFDPDKNKTFKYANCCPDELKAYTEVERTIAEDAYIPKDLEELREKASNGFILSTFSFCLTGSRQLQEQLQTGQRTDTTAYIRILPRHLEDRKVMYINDVNGSPLVVINRTMEMKQRTELVIDMKNLFPELKPTNSQAEGFFFRFPTLHFSHYIRFATRLKLNDPTIDPVNIDPAAYRRNGKRKVNSATFIPRASKEIQDHPEFYHLVTETLEPTLMWQSIELETTLQDVHEKLAEFANTLPGNEFSPAYPFGGFVVNINVSTRIHRDHKDAEGICSVLVVSENCKGGGLVLVELGLVIDFENGDLVTFRSAKLTHFNLHFTGVRASLVFHSDGAGLTNWAGDGERSRGGWAGNRNFRST